jgi:hypothetical protein
MRSTIERMFYDEDPYGNQGPVEWQTAGTSVPCYVWIETGRATNTRHDDRAELQETNTRAVFPLDTDIRKEDRISAVTDRQGTELFGEHYVQGSPMRRKDHIEVLLKEYE